MPYSDKEKSRFDYIPIKIEFESGLDAKTNRWGCEARTYLGEILLTVDGYASRKKAIDACVNLFTTTE